MTVTHVVLLITLVSFCASLPTRSRAKDSEDLEAQGSAIVESHHEMEIVNLELLKNVLVDLDSANHVIAKRITREAPSSANVLRNRSKRGIINDNGHQCPTGEGMTPGGECTPCRGQTLPGCPDVAYDEDYDNDA